MPIRPPAAREKPNQKKKTTHSLSPGIGEELVDL